MFQNFILIFHKDPNHPTGNVGNDNAAHLSHQQIVNDMLSLMQLIN